VTPPAGQAGTVIVPDHFLRRWDPVTVFFAKDVGPAKGGPEDHTERLVTLSPPHPGAFTWLDARTLQFRPAEPWPPLARFAWAARETKARPTTLRAAPTSASRSTTPPRSRSPRSPSRPPSRSAWSSWAAARRGTRRSGTAPIR